MESNFSADENKSKLAANTNLVKSKSFILFTLDDITKNISVNLYTDMNAMEFSGFMQFIIRSCENRLEEFMNEIENTDKDDENIDDLDTENFN